MASDPMNDAAPLNGLVLAGGKSSRMGRDKALVIYRDRVHLRDVMELVDRHAVRAWISIRADQAEIPVYRDYPQIHDRVGDQGPLGGMVSAFEAYPGCAWLVVACDLPFLTHEALATLIAARGHGNDAVAYRDAVHGGPEPLCAIYEPPAQFVLVEEFQLHQRSPRDALARARTRIIPPAAPGLLTNVNRPHQHRRAREAGAGPTGEPR